jgi:hypothetical protein
METLPHKRCSTYRSNLKSSPRRSATNLNPQKKKKKHKPLPSNYWHYIYGLFTSAHIKYRIMAMNNKLEIVQNEVIMPWFETQPRICPDWFITNWKGLHHHNRSELRNSDPPNTNQNCSAPTARSSEKSGRTRHNKESTKPWIESDGISHWFGGGGGGSRKGRDFYDNKKTGTAVAQAV